MSQNKFTAYFKTANSDEPSNKKQTSDDNCNDNGQAKQNQTTVISTDAPFHPSHSFCFPKKRIGDRM